MEALAGIAQKFQELCISIANNSVPITIGLIILIALLIGLRLMMGKKGKQDAVEWIPPALIGAIVALGAVSIGTAIGASLQF